MTSHNQNNWLNLEKPFHISNKKKIYNLFKNKEGKLWLRSLTRAIALAKEEMQLKQTNNCKKLLNSST